MIKINHGNRTSYVNPQLITHIITTWRYDREPKKKWWGFSIAFVDNRATREFYFETEKEALETLENVINEAKESNKS